MVHTNAHVLGGVCLDIYITMLFRYAMVRGRGCLTGFGVQCCMLHPSFWSYGMQGWLFHLCSLVVWCALCAWGILQMIVHTKVGSGIRLFGVHGNNPAQEFPRWVSDRVPGHRNWAEPLHSLRPNNLVA